MICDKLGVPLEEGQTVVFEWGGKTHEGKVAAVREIVPHGQRRMVVLVAKYTFGVPEELGPAPNMPGIYVTGAQEKQITSTATQ